MMQTAAKATTASMVVIREADKPDANTRAVHAAPHRGGLALKQLTFDWNVLDKYQELCNFE